MEPGSGSTIMGYAGITGATDVQAHSDAYFHAITIQQVTNYVKSTTCQTNTATGNNVPTASAGLDYTIPKSTPFMLTGDGTDADGDALTFCWEQMDENAAATTYPSTTATSGVAFRSFTPTTSKTRYFPQLSTVLTGSTATKWEAVPSVARALNFRFTVRDNVAGGGTNNSDDMVVTVDGAKGPFTVTSQSTSGITWLSGTSETITWNVNGTNTINGAANVDILLSTDGGLTYTTTLISNTPNDGSEVITVPNIPAIYCRVMVKPTNNVFFNVNTTDFSIDYTVTSNCTTYTVSPSIPITDNNGSNFDTSTLSVPDNITISDVNVGVDITHSYLSDLQIKIANPGGTEVIIFDRSCTSNINMNVTFDDAGSSLACASPTVGTYVPANALSAFNSQTSNGTWTLSVNDNARIDTGTLNTWTLELCYSTATLLAVEEYEFSQFKVYPNPSNGFMTISLLSQSSEDVVIMLYDVTGRKVSTRNYSNFSTKFEKEIDFGKLTSGIYLLKVKSGNQMSSKQLVIY